MPTISLQMRLSEESFTPASAGEEMALCRFFDSYGEASHLKPSIKFLIGLRRPADDLSECTTNASRTSRSRAKRL
jgi:hypothetical protein